MTKQLSIGYSPCPNDTFIFYALMHGKIPLSHICFAEPRLEDVETLNSWAMRGRLDVTKLSFHALGHAQNNYTMLESGAALGRGCGPLLVTKSGREKDDPACWNIAIPGNYTTAALLLKLSLPEHCQTVVMRFDRIIKAVATGEVDAGVIIHESCFTYQDHGLVCVRDLGQWWERDTGLPIPLGCIAARKNLAPKEIRETEQAIAASIRWAFEHEEECADYIQQHAQEMNKHVISEHIGLYVNDFSLGLGKEGRAAVQELFRRGRTAGVFAASSGDEK